MRPIKLWMTAFGPYAGTQEVDFREATDAGLFGIYGPVGSGKSSVFSAISFALFGEGAKEEQAARTLRSDHAAPAVLTEVSFLFELADKRYFVRRQPEQTRPKLRGDGETDERHSAWLFDASDIDIDQVTKDNCGRVIGEVKVGVVDAQIRALLGYDLDQFRQIVLLPQGKFERFLASDSAARLGILRGLFDVSLYQRMTLRMKERAAEAQREVQDGMRLRQQRLMEAGYNSTDELATAIEEALADQAAKDAEFRDAEAGHREAHSQCSAGEALGRQFDMAEEADRTLAALQRRKPEIEIVAKRHDAACRARQLIDRDETVVQVTEAHVRAETAVVTAQAAVNAAVSASAAANARFEELKADATETERLRLRSIELERFAKCLTDASDLKEEADRARLALVEARRAAERADAQVTRLTGAIDAHRTEVEKAHTADIQRVTLGGDRETARNALERAREYAAACSGVKQAAAAADQAKQRADALRGTVAELQAEVKAREVELLAGQAQLLASQLEHGSPCPVCGSEEHPAPAHGGGASAAGLEEAWRAAAKKCEDSNTKLHQADSELSKSSAIFEDRKTALAQLTVPSETVEVLEARVGELNEKLGGLDGPKDIAQLAAKLDKLKQELGVAEAEKQAKAEAVADRARQDAACRRSYDDQIANVPEEHRDSTALEELRQSVRSEIGRRETAFEDARASVSEAKARTAAATSELAAANRRLAECAEEITKAQSAFELRRTQLGLTPEAFETARLDIERIPNLESELSDYKTAVFRAEGGRDETQKAIKGKQKPDVAALRAKSEEAGRKASEASQAAAHAGARYKNLVLMRETLHDQFSRLRTIEEQSAPLRELAAAFDGQNKARTDLETFAIGAMFDQVLEAANLRLDPMTQGRYRLQRDLQAVGGRKRRGLDIQVHDIQTGRAREVSTLSGGETFMAALALALGLADIVEMSHGLIRLDTIFIDEGFGSLDSDGESGTLDHVLRVLQDIVGQRRAVGLISHVSVVQEAVPNGFSVIKGSGGSRIEQRPI